MIHRLSCFSYIQSCRIAL